jgi:hypothetical protein
MFLANAANNCGLLSVTTCALMLLKDMSKVKSIAALYMRFIVWNFWFIQILDELKTQRFVKNC